MPLHVKVSVQADDGLGDEPPVPVVPGEPARPEPVELVVVLQVALDDVLVEFAARKAASR